MCFGQLMWVVIDDRNFHLEPRRKLSIFLSSNLMWFLVMARPAPLVTRTGPNRLPGIWLGLGTSAETPFCKVLSKKYSHEIWTKKDEYRFELGRGWKGRPVLSIAQTSST